MNPVATYILPDNGRFELDPSGSEATLGEFATLPIPMPETVTVWTDPNTGKPLAMWADASRIRPADFATVWVGVEQFNADLASRDVAPAVREEAAEATVPEEWDDDGEE